MITPGDDTIYGMAFRTEVYKPFDILSQSFAPEGNF